MRQPALYRLARNRSGQRGFSLLEVLIAFAILAIALGVIMRIFSSGLRNVMVGEDYTRAILLAQSKLAALGVEEPLQTGEQTGAFDEDYRWRVMVQPYDQTQEVSQQQGTRSSLSGQQARQQVGQQVGQQAGGVQRRFGTLGDAFAAGGLLGGGVLGAPQVIPYQVVVAVTWGSSTQQRSVALTTLRLLPQQPG